MNWGIYRFGHQEYNNVNRQTESCFQIQGVCLKVQNTEKKRVFMKKCILKKAAASRVHLWVLYTIIPSSCFIIWEDTVERRAHVWVKSVEVSSSVCLDKKMVSESWLMTTQMNPFAHTFPKHSFIHRGHSFLKMNISQLADLKKYPCKFYPNIG